MPPPRLQRPASRIRALIAVAPARGFDVRIYDGTPKISALSAFWRMRSRQCLRVFVPGMSFLTSKPRGSVATLPAPPLWEPARTAVCSDVGQNWGAPKMYAIQASLRTMIYQTFLSADNESYTCAYSSSRGKAFSSELRECYY